MNHKATHRDPFLQLGNDKSTDLTRGDSELGIYRDVRNSKPSKKSN